MIDHQELQDDEPQTPQRVGPSRKYPWAIAVVVVLFVVIPFLSWYGTWFGRQLSDSQMESYLNDQHKPRNVQHALEQIVTRINQHDDTVKRWYPDVSSLADYPVPQVRTTAAWAMQYDNSYVGFHQALLKMLNDEYSSVRHQAALSLVVFGDSASRSELVEMLKSTTLLAESAGIVELFVKEEGIAVAANGPVARIKEDDGQVKAVHTIDVGRVESVLVSDGARVEAGSELMRLLPSPDQAREALKALSYVGQSDDIPSVQRYTGQLPGMPDDIRKQALSTLEAIRKTQQN